MVHRSMRIGSRVADELYIKRVLLALEDFLFFSLYSFSCIAKLSTTLKQLRLLCCLDFLETNIEPLVLFSDITLLSPISPMPDPIRYNPLLSIRNKCQYQAHDNSESIYI
jgi:hypothetical protein